MAGEILHGADKENIAPPLVDRLFSEDPLDTIIGSEPIILLEGAEDRRHEAQDWLLQWGGMPALLHYSEMACDAGVSVDTAKRYLEYLRLSYQVVLLQPYHRNITSTVVKTPKIYWVDLGILRRLCGFKGMPTGEMYETYVVGELVKWMKTAQSEGELYFYRTRSGLEIDLVLETQQGIVGMEIKSRDTVGSADVRALREVAAKLGRE
jgi:predicted AAA+ superfamily ATPase